MKSRVILCNFAVRELKREFVVEMNLEPQNCLKSLDFFSNV